MVNISRLLATLILCLFAYACEARIFRRRAKVQVVAFAEKRLADEYPKTTQIRTYFCKLFREVQIPFTQISKDNDIQFRIELSSFRTIDDINEQPFLEANVWNHNGEAFYLPRAATDFWKYLRGRPFSRRYDVAILFTRLKEAVPSSRGGPYFFLGPSMSRRDCHDSNPNVAILNPDAGLVAYELANFLGCRALFANKWGWLKYGGVLNITVDEISKCNATGIIELMKSRSGLCYRRNSDWDPMKCREILAKYD